MSFLLLFEIRLKFERSNNKFYKNVSFSYSDAWRWCWCGITFRYIYMNPFFRIEYLLILAVTFIVIDIIIHCVPYVLFDRPSLLFVSVCFVFRASRFAKINLYFIAVNSNEMKTKRKSKTAISRIISLVQSMTHNERSARANSFQHQQYRNINNTLGCIVGYEIREKWVRNRTRSL